MSEWKQRRFWTQASIAPEEGGFGIRLDARAVRTPAKAALAVPGAALAQAIAAEWDAQAELIDPNTMPLTRIANSAIDKVRPQREAVADMIAAYGQSDLLCYRAEGPPDLVARQHRGWDPLLAWAQAALGAPLDVTTGVMPRPQPAASVSVLRAQVLDFDAYDLAPLHDLVALSGSLVIGLAALHGHAPIETLWALSRIDETYQIEQWGHDDDAAETAAIKAGAFHDAARFHALRHAG